MEADKQQRALGFAVASFIIGICTVPLWILLMSLSEALWVYIAPIVALAGLVLGVIGLVMSIRRETRSVKGIVFASIGIVLNFFAAAATINLLYILTYTMEPM